MKAAARLLSSARQASADTCRACVAPAARLILRRVFGSVKYWADKERKAREFEAGSHEVLDQDYVDDYPAPREDDVLSVVRVCEVKDRVYVEVRQSSGRSVFQRLLP